MSRPRGLRRRMVSALALFSVAVSLLFSFFAVMFVYMVEDRFFANVLGEELEHQRRSWTETGGVAPPLRSYVTVYRDVAELPADLRQDFRPSATPMEYFGDEGRHYHVQTLPLGGDRAPVHVVAEVSGQLVVRPILGNILSGLAALTGGVLVLTFAAGYVLARRVTAPLERLADLVSSTAPDRLPSGFATSFPDDEIGLLAGNLEQALTRIRLFIEREQHFTRDASHELRTPIAVVQGAAELLARQELAPAAAAQVQRIRTSCAEMARTVEMLLSLAREESLPAPLEDVELLPLVEAAVVTHAHLLDGKAISVEVDVPGGWTVRGRRSVLTVLLSNLIANAFAHTPEGAVRVAMEASSLVVGSTGPGIDPAVADEMFEPGIKGRDSAGFGLGLSIVRRLCDRHGIGVEIESRPDAGTRAIVRF